MSDKHADVEVDIAAIGYPAARRAFNETLELCIGKLSRSEVELAEDILDLTELEEEPPGAMEMLADTALFSRKEGSNRRASAMRPIDRIAPKLPVKRDRLKSVIAERLPSAIFSIFEVEGAAAEGEVRLRDLLDDRRLILVMDQALAAQAAIRKDWLIAGRLVDLGPWHISFGIVFPIRKSEAVAIRLAVNSDEEVEAARGSLHELIYPAQLHGYDILMAAMEPVIRSFAVAIDSDLLDMTDFAARLEAFLQVPVQLRPSERRSPVRA
jgi:hypothetical protein